MKVSDGVRPDAELTFDGHLEVLRKMLVRICIVVFMLGCVIFYLKEQTFGILLAPRSGHFFTFEIVEWLLDAMGVDFQFGDYDVKLINTEVSAQLMTHINVSCVLALLCASPYIIYELLKFILHGLYENERRYSRVITATVYGLFVAGVLMSYFVLFPISFRYLTTYHVDDEIANVITLDSYVSTFSTLTFLMGIMFQLPVISYLLAKMRIVTSKTLMAYRAHAFIIIMIVAAIITPPDILTLVLVSFPIYGLYGLSIMVVRRVERNQAGQ